MFATSDPRERGGVLLMALVPVMLISFLAAAFLQLSGAMVRRQQQALDVKRAFYLCEAGLHEAMSGLYLGLTGNVGTQAEPAYFGEGYFWVEASEPDSRFVQLDCFASIRGAHATLSWVVHRIEFNLSSFGFFSGKKLKVQKGSLIDGYDSTLGSYADQKAAGLTLKAGRLASNENIEIEGKKSQWTYVNGSAQPGLGTTVKTSDGVTLTGDTTSLEEYMLVPEFEVPAFPLEKDVKHKSPVPLVLPSGSRQYEKIEISSNRELLVRGPATIVVEELVVRTGGKLRLDTSGGPIGIHVLKTANFEQKSTLVTSDDSPRGASLVIGDGLRDAKKGEVKIGDNAKLTALIYAPHDQVKLGKGVELFGSVVAGELQLDDNARLHFDHALGLQEHLFPRSASWRVVDLGSGPLDPFANRGLDRASLPSPAQAHRDVWLEIKYREGPGLPKVEYKGWWHSFDWSVVYELTPHYKAYDAPGGKELLHVHP